MTKEQELKAEMMTKLIGEIAHGKLEEFVGKIGKAGIQEFITNVEFMVDEIIRKSSK